MAHIPGTISIADGLTKSPTHTQLIALLEMGKSQNVSGKSKGVLRKSHPRRNQYLASPRY